MNIGQRAVERKLHLIRTKWKRELLEPESVAMNGEVPLDDGSSVDDRIDERCDAFESAWRNGQRPSIATSSVPKTSRIERRFFANSCSSTSSADDRWANSRREDQYLRDFPEFAAQIHATKFRYGSAAFSTARANGEDTVKRQLEAARQPRCSLRAYRTLRRRGDGRGLESLGHSAETKCDNQVASWQCIDGKRLAPFSARRRGRRSIVASSVGLGARNQQRWRHVLYRRDFC